MTDKARAKSDLDETILHLREAGQHALADKVKRAKDVLSDDA